MLSFVLSPCVGPSAECGVVALDDGNGDWKFEVVEHGDAASTTGLAPKAEPEGAARERGSKGRGLPVRHLVRERVVASSRVPN
jgi:hypothetical protein